MYAFFPVTSSSVDIERDTSTHDKLTNVYNDNTSTPGPNAYDFTATVNG